MREIDDFLLYCRARNKSQHTIRSYGATLREFTSGLSVDVQQVTPDDLERFLGALYSRGVSKTTRAQRLAAIKSWFSWMEQEGIIASNFADAFQGPRCSRRRMDVPTRQEACSLCEGPFNTAFPERDCFLVELLYGSGIREDEAVSVNLSDISGNRFTVHGKGLKQRTVFLTEHAQRALTGYLPMRATRLKGRKTDALFVGLRCDYGDRLTVRSVHRTVKQFGVAHGMPWLSPHSLRRAFATHLDEGGMPHHYISRLLGHSKLSITERYIAQASRSRLLAAYERGRGGAL